MNKKIVLIVEMLEKWSKLMDKDLLMPNVPFPTAGGEVFWTDLAEIDGWRVQRNTVTGHCRLLDPENIRRAWGTYTGVMSLFGKVKAFNERR